MGETLSCFSALGRTQVCLPGEETTILIAKCFVVFFSRPKKKKRQGNQCPKERGPGSYLFSTTTCLQFWNWWSLNKEILYKTRSGKWVSDSGWTSLWMQHITSADNKYSCQAPDNEFHSTLNTQLIYCCEQITDPSKLMSPEWTVIISSNTLIVVMSLYILHKGGCIEANTLITEWSFISSDIQSLSSWHWPWE